MIAQKITIETDEYGFLLLIDDGYERHTFRLPEPEALYETVKREIGPWLYEKEHGRLAFLCSPEDVDESAGLADLGHKHPEYHSVHADIWDARAGK